MKQKLIDETECNYYRTKYFIVKQELSVQINNVDDNILFSKDTFLKRNRQLDKEYEKKFKDRINTDGKRLHVSASTRTYIF